MDGENYIVEEKPIIGRCLVAAKDLEPLDLILIDRAAVSGPDQLADVPVCLSCYLPLDKIEGNFYGTKFSMCTLDTY